MEAQKPSIDTIDNLDGVVVNVDIDCKERFQEIDIVWNNLSLYFETWCQATGKTSPLLTISVLDRGKEAEVKESYDFEPDVMGVNMKVGDRHLIMIFPSQIEEHVRARLGELRDGLEETELNWDDISHDAEHLFRQIAYSYVLSHEIGHIFIEDDPKIALQQENHERFVQEGLLRRQKFPSLKPFEETDIHTLYRMSPEEAAADRFSYFNYNAPLMYVVLKPWQ